jgi:hypothetical protein
MDSQLPDDPNDSAGFLKAFREGAAESAKRRITGRLAPILFVFDKKWKRAYTKFHAYVDVYVKRALEATTAESVRRDAEKKKETR